MLGRGKRFYSLFYAGMQRMLCISHCQAWLEPYLHMLYDAISRSVLMAIFQVNLG